MALTTTITIMRIALLLLVLTVLAGDRVASAERPRKGNMVQKKSRSSSSSGGAPSSAAGGGGRGRGGGDANGQCATPGSCDADDGENGDSDEYSDDDDSDDDSDDDDDSGDSGLFGGNNGNRNNKSGGDDTYEIDGVDPDFLLYLSNLETYDVHEMREALSEIVDNAGITTAMQRHVERTLFSRQFPDGEASSGRSRAYATFGSLLDISTSYSASWGGSTEFGGKPAWMASLFYREDIIAHERTVPCLPDLSDDYDAHDDDDDDGSSCCHIGVSIDDYVSVRGTEDKRYEHMEIAAYWDILDEGTWRTGRVSELEFGGDRKFDTILASGVLAGGEEDLEDADGVLEKLISLLRPGGVVFFVGIEPPGRVDGPEDVYNDILDTIDSAKDLAGEEPTLNLPARDINSRLSRLGLDVFSSVRFPVKPTYDDIQETVNEGIEWINENESGALTPAVKKRYRVALMELLEKIEGVARRGPIFAGEHQYIIAAELPRDGRKGEEEKQGTHVEPTIYRPKPKYAGSSGGHSNSDNNNGNNHKGKNGHAQRIDGADPDLSGVETYEVHEMREALSEIVDNAGITTAMQRHVERTLFARQFPDGKVATSKRPAYASFGSLLDISTVYSASWGGSTEFGGKPAWVASIFFRRDIINHERSLPCTADLSNDYDAPDDDGSCCHIGVSLKDYVSVRGTDDKRREHMDIAAYWDMLDKGTWRTGNVLELDFEDQGLLSTRPQKFDTIMASGVLAGQDEDLENMDAVLEKVISLLKPGGVVFFVGIEPPGKVDGPEGVYNEILDTIDSAKRLAGEKPTLNLPATWINRNLSRLGLDVFSSVRFPVKPTYDDIQETVNEGIEWMDEDESGVLTHAIKEQYSGMLMGLLKKIEGVARRGPIFAGEHQYIIAAELPKDGRKKDPGMPIEPTVYQPKPKFAGSSKN